MVGRIPIWPGLSAYSDILIENGFDEFSETYECVGVHEKSRDDSPVFRWFHHAWFAGDIIINRNLTGPCSSTRGGKFLKTKDMSFVALKLVISGDLKSVFGETATALYPGEVHLIDPESHYFGVIEHELSTIAAKIPKAAIGWDPDKHPRHICLSNAYPVAAMMVKQALFALYDNIQAIDPDDAAQLASGFCGLLRGILAGDKADIHARNQFNIAKANVIKAYINANLTEAGLGADKICRQFGLSRASLYRLFTEEGGFNTYVSNQRLTKAFHILGSERPERGAIRRVAERYGYYDQAHFSREFKNKFHISPSDVAGIWQ